MGDRTCLTCGTVAFSVTRERACEAVTEAEQYYDKLPPAEQREYGRVLLLRSYETCSFCGGSYMNFREAKDSDCPIGVTLSPIIFE